VLPIVLLTLISKTSLFFFVAHLVFEISVCFGYQLPSLPQAYEQQKVAMFCIVT